MPKKKERLQEILKRTSEKTKARVFSRAAECVNLIGRVPYEILFLPEKKFRAELNKLIERQNAKKEIIDILSICLKEMNKKDIEKFAESVKDAKAGFYLFSMMVEFYKTASRPKFEEKRLRIAYRNVVNDAIKTLSQWFSKRTLERVALTKPDFLIDIAELITAARNKKAVEYGIMFMKHYLGG